MNKGTIDSKPGGPGCAAYCNCMLCRHDRKDKFTIRFLHKWHRRQGKKIIEKELENIMGGGK